MSKENWIKDAPCAQPVPTDDAVEPRLIDFYSNDFDEQQRAKAVCVTCPFKLQCLQYAYDGKERFGVWGGASGEELRRNQAINALGEAHVSKLGKIRCANCGPRSTQYLEVVERKRTRTTIKCGQCGLTWVARKSINIRQTNW
ncbi:WhiB family transcription factor [Arthrobacter phage Racecar]|nr:WhiB family transcription factor [Arthrobacter phage Racecar]